MIFRVPSSLNHSVILWYWKIKRLTQKFSKRPANQSHKVKFTAPGLGLAPLLAWRKDEHFPTWMQYPCWFVFANVPPTHWHQRLIRLVLFLENQKSSCARMRTHSRCGVTQPPTQEGVRRLSALQRRYRPGMSKPSTSPAYAFQPPRSSGSTSCFFWGCSQSRVYPELEGSNSWYF